MQRASLETASHCSISADWDDYRRFRVPSVVSTAELCVCRNRSDTAFLSGHIPPVQGEQVEGLDVFTTCFSFPLPQSLAPRPLGPTTLTCRFWWNRCLVSSRGWEVLSVGAMLWESCENPKLHLTHMHVYHLPHSSRLFFYRPHHCALIIYWLEMVKINTV